MRLNSRRSNIYTILISIITTFTFAFNLNVDFSMINATESSIESVNRVLDSLNKVKLVMGDYQFTDCFIFIGLLFFYYKTKQYVGKIRRYTLVPSVLFSFFMVFGYSYLSIGSWDLVFGEPIRLFLSLMIGIGYYFLFARMIDCIFWWCEQKEKMSLDLVVTETTDNKLFKKHPKLMYSILLIIAWSPYIIFRYPGAMNLDAKWQIQQFFGQCTFTSHHPPFHTLLLGGCVAIGKIFDSNNFGVWIYVVAQSVIFAYAFSSSIHFLIKSKTSKFIRNVVFLIYGFVPLFPIWATTAMKDSIYSAIFVLYIVCLLEIIGSRILIKRMLINLCIYSLLLMLLRNNGIYVVLPTILLIIYWKIGKCTSTKKENKTIIIYSIAPFLLYVLLNALMINLFSIQKGSIVESFSVMTQQTGRYVNEYQDEVTEEEARVINNVMDYENMADNYDPYLSDRVKFTWKETATKEDTNKYFKIWFQQFLKHPNVYFEAAFHLNYGFFYPGFENINYYTSADVYYNEGEFMFSHPRFLKNIADVIMDTIRVIDQIPVYNLFMNSAVYYWIVIVMIAGICKSKNKKWLIVYTPLIINILICLVTPACLGNVRYAFPVMFVTPVLLGWIITIFKKEENGYKNEME